MSQEDRQERSRRRAEEYAKRRRMRLILLVTGLVTYVVVPLMWYGGVEFGWVHPIRTPEFKQALHIASLVLLLVILFLLPEFYSRRSEGKKTVPKAEPAKPLTER